MSATACIGLNTPRWTLLVADSGRDLWRLGEGDTRRELVNGQVRELAPVGAVHGRVTGRIYRRLAEYVDASSCTSPASRTNRQNRLTPGAQAGRLSRYAGRVPERTGQGPGPP